MKFFFMQIEEEESTGYIRFEKFLPMMTKVLMERRYESRAQSYRFINDT